MADYLITGKKGAGKSLFAVGLIKDAMMQKKKVATNLDIDLEKLLPADSKLTLLRIPDRPTAGDMLSIGRGQDGVVEDENGILVIDEAGTFLNARSWGDKARQPLLDWLVHSRKYGWDTYFICQGIEQLDKQMRTTLLEYRVNVTRTDKWPIPFVTPALRMLTGFDVRLPKMHIGTIRHGLDRDSLVIDRKIYRGSDLYAAYATQQVFLDRDNPGSCGLYSPLSAWHTKGRYLPKKKTLRDYLQAFINPPKPAPIPPKPKHPLIELLQCLPEDQRLKHFRRLDSLGAFV